MFLHIGPTVNNRHELPGPAEESHDDDGPSAAADPLAAVKEDQMMGAEVRSVPGFAAAAFPPRMGSGGADVAASSAALRSYLCSFQLRLSPDETRLGRIGCAAHGFVGSFISRALRTCNRSRFFKEGCEVFLSDGKDLGSNKVESK